VKKPFAGPFPPIVTLKHLAEWMGNMHGVTKRQAVAMLANFVGDIGRALKKGSKIRITDLGILQVRHRAARMGRNPATGEAIKIKASKKVAFRVAKTLKQAV
jgi:DNA-binding protein HU-beta